MHFCRWKSSSVQQTLQYKYNKKGDFKSIEISFSFSAVVSIRPSGYSTTGYIDPETSSG